MQSAKESSGSFRDGAHLIEIENLCKVYASGQGQLRALDEVNLSVRNGEFVAVLGPSGCGKSTLLAVLGLLERHDAGEYRLAGTRVASLGFNQSAGIRNQHIGLIFQAFNLVADLTVLDNVILPLRYSRSVPRAKWRERSLKVLARVGLSDRAADYPHQLSGGQQQRIAIARAMVTDPSLILADEPTGNLDSTHADEVMRLLKEFHEDGTTIVFVTHDESLAAHAERRIRMRDGKILEDAHVG